MDIDYYKKGKERMMKKFKFKNVIYVLIAVYLSYLFVNQYVVMKSLKSQMNLKNEQFSKAQEKNQKLQDEIKMSQSDVYLEKLAREKLGYVKQGETPVISNK